MSTVHETAYCIALQPICDKAMVHVADELLYRASADASFAQVEDHELVTARACNIAFYETGVQNLVGTRLLFINMPQEWLLNPNLLPPMQDQVVIEVLENVKSSPEVIQALQNIKQRGYVIALDDFMLTPETRDLVNIADIIKVDLSQPFDEQAIKYYKSRGVQLLAEKVEDLETFKTMKEKGFELFQGYFYARPEVQAYTAQERTSNHAALFRLLTELHRSNVNYRELENLITQDPELTYALLKYVNSALFHFRGKIQSIRQAINALGLNYIRTITLTLLLAKNGPASRILLNKALTRASMCKILAREQHNDTDSAFTVGLISMIGIMLGRCVKDVVQQLPVAAHIVDAILERKNTLGKVLNDVERFENADVAQWAGGKVNKFNQVWLESQAWTTQTLMQLTA